ncbi:alpha/beta fold hydrolase [Oceanicoccus sp. KOV_DT_Chl]|uniref:alpha/beta hydrolase family protein n=1 Tax=Oceanicoccus sp. KOV_DT_Chl TaxID=1904639 RepID=UPI000C7C5AC1|nr:alpha/beta fold hydrolase [Oceanicoccus sp. KOV_DT_Chl]
MMCRLVIIFALVLTVWGCADEVVLPEAQPLKASAEALSTLYKIDKGPYQVVSSTDLILAVTADSELQLSVFYPAADDEKFPLLLFSHGNWSDKDQYDAVINHWVSHGYVVIAPNHLDCCSAMHGIINSIRYGQFGLIEERMRDFALLLDNLDRVEQLVAGLSGKIDHHRIAATGHSFGAFSAQQFGGAGTFNPDTEQFVYFRDARIKAIVAISPPGPMFDVINDKSWQQMDQPMLLTTGTWDSNARFWPDWRLHKMSFDTATPGVNYALITQGADHYLGNLICRLDREQVAQHDALKMLNVTTIAFLDAYVKELPAAKEFIVSDSLAVVSDGFSVIERR